MIARIPWARGNALPVRSGLQELHIGQGQGSRFILKAGHLTHVGQSLLEALLQDTIGTPGVYSLISYIKYGILFQGLDPGNMIAGGDERKAPTE